METFKDVISGDQLVLVDFFATWCQPCKMMHPILEQVKEVLGDRIRIIKVDVDKYGVTASQPMEQREQKPSWLGLCRVATEEDDSQYHIQSVPTLILFRQGEVLWRTSGVVQRAELLATIDPFLK
ncbi:MAG: thioredoxin domain-containing protein [Prevotella sp.]|nr:thioredoxin domain-containing protein [Prevotella sp.]